MAIEEAFERLVGRFDALRDAFHGLRLTAVEDRPPRDEVLLVERLGNLVEDLDGWLAEGLIASTEARDAVKHPLDAYRARQALGTANERFIRLEYRFFGEALSYDTVGGLARFGRQRGREWLGWSESVVQALEACRQPVNELDAALLHTWQELTERLSMRSVSLQTTNIGQQISPSVLERSAGARDRRGVPQDAMT